MMKHSVISPANFCACVPRATNRSVVKARAMADHCVPTQLPFLNPRDVPEMARSLMNDSPPAFVKGACLTPPQLARLTAATKQGAEHRMKEAWAGLQAERGRELDPRTARNELIAAALAVCTGVSVGAPIFALGAAGFGINVPGTWMLSVPPGIFVGFATHEVARAALSLLARVTDL